MTIKKEMQWSMFSYMHFGRKYVASALKQKEIRGKVRNKWFKLLSIFFLLWWILKNEAGEEKKHAFFYAYQGFWVITASLFRFHQIKKIGTLNRNLNHFQQLLFCTFPPPRNFIFLVLVPMPRFFQTKIYVAKCHLISI